MQVCSQGCTGPRHTVEEVWILERQSNCFLKCPFGSIQASHIIPLQHGTLSECQKIHIVAFMHSPCKNARAHPAVLHLQRLSNCWRGVRYLKDCKL